MDGFLLAALVRELNTALTQLDRGLPVGKVAAAGRDAVLLDLRRRDGRWLFLAARPHDSRLHPTDCRPRDADATSEPPFVARLRKALRGARLTYIVKAAGERSVTLTFDGFDDTEQPTRWLLRHDLTGRYANLWLLTADEVVVDALRPWDGTPGEPYRHRGGEDRRLTWDAVTPDVLPGSAAALERFLLDHVRGCRPSVAREAAFRAQSAGMWAAFESVRAELLCPTAFFLYERPDGPELSLVRLTHAPEAPAMTFTSAQEAAAAFFERLEHQTAQSERRRRWRRAVTTWRQRLERALQKLDEADAAARDAEQWRRWGELLYANLATARRTPAGVEVVDYYTETQPTIVIPLASVEEDLTAAAQRFFQRYQRAQRTLAANAERRATLEAELAAAVRLEQMTAAASEAEEEAWFAELCARLPFDLQPREDAPAGKTPREPNDWAGLRRYRGPEGYEIVVGRTARDNDRLTFTLARPHDLWLHAADYPGAHVVIRNPQRKTVPPQVILAAAELAAYFSQAKQAAWVDVQVAERRHVARPRKGAPGEVLVRESRTVTAAPREVLPRMA
ncbi:MAG: NFACT RNA binding domain-containing protein [Chloracidobacterium sp.]|nr:NFACT RNA binding domain-containing protein [Chloracidobacterium sp.]MDW8217875.1 NFACT RNA binding domain-containing protein [Acidobacteriota bacterium]